MASWTNGLQPAIYSAVTDTLSESSPWNAPHRIVPEPSTHGYIGTEQRVGETLGLGLQEGDIQDGLRDGGCIRGLFIVERRLPEGPGYVAYFRTSWKRGFHVLRTYRDRSDRIYRDFDRLLRLIRDEFRFAGAVTVFVAGDPELQRFRALLPQDGPTIPVSIADPVQGDTENLVVSDNLILPTETPGISEPA